VLASVPAGPSRGGAASLLLVLSQSICLPLSAHQSPDNWQVSFYFLHFLTSLRSSLFVQSVPSFLTISSNDATRVQQGHSQLTAPYDTSTQTATNSAVHAERMTRPASLKMHCTKLTSGKVPIPSLTLCSLPHRRDTTHLDVQVSILSGRIDDAIDCLNANFPSTLPPSIPIREDAGPSTPTGEPSQSKTVKTVLPFTVEPARLYLDLRILAFIEASRTKPLPYPLTESVASNPVLTPRISPPNNLRDPSGEMDGDAHLARLLKHVHEIYDCAQALQDPQKRAETQHELSAVSGLLAYKVPEQSPMAKYLTQDRREAVSNEINSAILRVSLSPPVTIVELLM
jgi:hypothetical protein